MAQVLVDFQKITNADEYFHFFGLEFDPQVVNVNRLHILKKFSLAMKAIDQNHPNLSESEQLELYKSALAEAYQVFVTSNSLEQKLFKVFQKPQQDVVLLTEITTEGDA